MQSNETKLPPTESEPTRGNAVRKSEKSVSLRWLALAICVAIITSVLLTYTFTARAKRLEYTQRLAEQQAVIDSLKGDGSPSSRNLALLDAYLDYYSYYAAGMDREEMLAAAFKAYLAASGDKYAQYYSEQEYLAMVEESNGNYGGIGVVVVNDTVEVNGSVQKVFRITRIYENAPALEVGIRVGDLIYAVFANGVWRTVDDLNYSAAEQMIRGVPETQVQIKVYRAQEGAYASQSFDVVRRKMETESVHGTLCEADTTVGIVRIEKFNRNTPSQFKEQVEALRSQGATRFVFDVRGNPGGDLQSIKAILSYFLQAGDLVLEAKDRSGAVAERHLVEAVSHTGDYADCSVAASEIGMYADLEMVILCDENTASAAEVFVATLRDYKEIRGLRLQGIVGEQTLGKGIMQSTRRVEFEDMVGYVKVTTHAYVTQCGVSYHGEGIAPTDRVLLSEEAKKYDLTLLPQEMDAQLRFAVAKLQNQ